MRHQRLVPRWLIWLSYLFVLPCFAEQPASFETYIAASDNGRTPNLKPEKHFDCSDMVYAVIKSNETTIRVAQNHDLVVNWINPANKLEQETRYDFSSYGKDTLVWAWLRLSAPAGAAFGRIFDPSFGMAKFIGDWRVEIIIDGEKVATHQFNVLC